MSRPFPSRNYPPNNNFVRVNGKIRAREVRVIGDDNQQLGVLPIGEALTLARQKGVDLVEVAASANPPVCRLVDFGKYRYEQAKKDKESKKHQHANKVKEVQLSANIDPHDFSVKLNHAIDFLCEDIKVKVTLRFHGRQMAHQEFGFEKVKNFLKAVEPWGHRDFEPKLIGKGINVMITPLPRAKRAKHPNEGKAPAPEAGTAPESAAPAPNGDAPKAPSKKKSDADRVPTNAEDDKSFGQNPFANLNLNSNS